MSTKSPIVQGRKFELFTDWQEQKSVMLRLVGAQFDTSKDSITIHIPIALWEFLRTITVQSTEAAAFTDEQLLARAEKQVDEKIAKWKNDEKSRRKLPAKKRRFLRNIFGQPDRPREIQVREFVEHLLCDRESARALLKKIAAYRREASPEAERRRCEAHSRYWKEWHKKRTQREAQRKRRDEAWKARQQKAVERILGTRAKRDSRR